MLEVTMFLKQVGLALSGASCLWGLYFLIKSKKHKETQKKSVFYQTAQKMIKPLSIGVGLTAISLLFFDFYYPLKAGAHEGISIIPNIETTREAFFVMWPIFALFFVIYIVGILYKKIKPEKFKKNLNIFYSTELILSAILISIPAWSGSLNLEQIFFAGHGFHSILTLGTVLILDFIFILTKHSDEFERNLYPSLINISGVIWLGLAIDFISSSLIFDQAVVFDSKFIFMQMVIGIIILNGVLLSGPITKKLIQVAKDNKIKEPSYLWDKIITISGSISISSWITVTFVDNFQNISINYLQMIYFYLAFIALVYISYEILEQYKIGARW